MKATITIEIQFDSKNLTGEDITEKGAKEVIRDIELDARHQLQGIGSPATASDIKFSFIIDNK